MTKIEPFEKHAPEYEAWFEKNRFQTGFGEGSFVVVKALKAKAHE